MTSLDEFERIERELRKIEFILTGELPARPSCTDRLDDKEALGPDSSKDIMSLKSSNKDDPNLLIDFEDLETACYEIALIKMKASEQAKTLEEGDNTDNVDRNKCCSS